MQIRVYIEPNGDVTITALVGDLVPVAFSLDQTDQQMQRWLDVLSETGKCRLEEGEIAHGRISTRQLVES
jgi:hypothetical protein